MLFSQGQDNPIPSRGKAGIGGEGIGKYEG